MDTHPCNIERYRSVRQQTVGCSDERGTCLWRTDFWSPHHLVNHDMAGVRKCYISEGEEAFGLCLAESFRLGGRDFASLVNIFFHTSPPEPDAIMQDLCSRFPRLMLTRSCEL
jgi:hypothetical protein